MANPKRLRVVKGNKKLQTWTRDVYEVKNIEPFENGAKLSLLKLSGQAQSAKNLVVFVRYMKHLDNDEFNASKGDGVNKIKFQVIKRTEEGRMSVTPSMEALLERQKTQPSQAFPGEEKPVRKGSFKVSSKLLKMWKDSAKEGDDEHAKGVGKGPHMLLFNRVRDAIEAIPRNDLPTIWGKDNMADAQDFVAMKPKLAFQMWMRNVKKVSPKLQKYIQAVGDNLPLVYYAFLNRVSGKEMADVIFKRHFETESGHPGELKRKKKWDEKKALRKQLKKQGIATEAKGPDWKKAAEKLMKTFTGKDQESFHKRAYLRAVIQGNSAQATHVAKNVLDPKTAKDLRMKLIDLAGMKESLGLPSTWKRIAGIEPSRYSLDEKKKTFPEARKEIMDYLKSQGWELSGPLKIPYATSPDGEFRLWFKAQAVYYDEGKPHTFKAARTVSYDFDIRAMDGPKFLATIKRMFKNSFHEGAGILASVIELTEKLR